MVRLEDHSLHVKKEKQRTRPIPTMISRPNIMVNSTNTSTTPLLTLLDAWHLSLDFPYDIDKIVSGGENQGATPTIGCQASIPTIMPRSIRYK